MTKKQKFFSLIFGTLFIGAIALVPVASVSAQNPCDPATAQKDAEGNFIDGNGNKIMCCGGVHTSIIGCDQTGSGSTQDTGLWGILILIINILSAGVGVVALGGIVFAAIMYTSAGGNEAQVKKAMGMISNIVIGVVAWALMFTLLNFLVPGGLFAAPAGP